MILLLNVQLLIKMNKAQRLIVATNNFHTKAISMMKDYFHFVKINNLMPPKIVKRFDGISDFIAKIHLYQLLDIKFMQHIDGAYFEYKINTVANLHKMITYLVTYEHDVIVSPSQGAVYFENGSYIHCRLLTDELEFIEFSEQHLNGWYAQKS